MGLTIQKNKIQLTVYQEYHCDTKKVIQKKVFKKSENKSLELHKTKSGSKSTLSTAVTPNPALSHLGSPSIKAEGIQGRRFTQAVK